MCNKVMFCHFRQLHWVPLSAQQLRWMPFCNQGNTAVKWQERQQKTFCSALLPTSPSAGLAALGLWQQEMPQVGGSRVCSSRDWGCPMDGCKKRWSTKARFSWFSSLEGWSEILASDGTSTPVKEYQGVGLDHWNCTVWFSCTVPVQFWSPVTWHS